MDETTFQSLGRPLKRASGAPQHEIPTLSHVIAAAYQRKGAREEKAKEAWTKVRQFTKSQVKEGSHTSLGLTTRTLNSHFTSPCLLIAGRLSNRAHLFPATEIKSLKRLTALSQLPTASCVVSKTGCSCVCRLYETSIQSAPARSTSTIMEKRRALYRLWSKSEAIFRTTSPTP